ncbi:glycoside hydrolase family 3 N-terminal domain-containing protein [Bradyrhizobium prioriisuperbiae]|uniref:glycoside hydrolase family 3 N-terminal domain-containing protein n=1 Tax=Bradyrhizobium prioriisuperbiae TaxID=2854389 RepID=UPI0028E2AEE2|nr:glycoside hydrolase family 3 N-terminal domain-containing protein [Bradyrhizobium prioritasuperba]
MLVIPMACVVVLLLWLSRGWVGRTVVKRRVARWLLVALWCVPPLGMLRSEAVFQGDKRAVLGAEQADVARLGQHFIVGYSRVEAVAPLVARGLIGGIYVTHHNIRGKTADDLRGEIAGLQALRRTAGLPPLVVVADQEGGIVSHLSPQLTALPALATLTELPKEERAEKAREYGATHGRELAQLGVTINLAPVVDLRPPLQYNVLDFNSLIGRRAISGNPTEVTEIAANYIRGLNAAHVGATIKHFPGLGRARDDTHHFTARIDTRVEELEATDWVPFRDLLAGGNAHLMVGHAAVTAVDPNTPASHSKRLVDGLIRSTWGYQGPIMTDDMVMGAVYQHGICKSTVSSLNAGVDWLLVAYDGAQYFRIFNCVLEASKRGVLDEAMLSKSNARLKVLSSNAPAVAEARSPDERSDIRD